MKFVKELPPPISGPGEGNIGKWKRVADELAAHPGQWALVAEGLTRGQSGSPVIRLKHYGCQTVTRGSAAGIDVYARWPKP